MATVTLEKDNKEDKQRRCDKRTEKKRIIMRDYILHGMKLIVTAATAAVALSSCIDEDLSDCGKDYRINYRLTLHSNIDVEINDVLTTDDQRLFATELKQALGSVFSDYATDNDLSFFVKDALSHHEANKMNANSASYTIYMPRNDYRHLALANMANETQVSIKAPELASTLMLDQVKTDTVESHNCGIFSSRLSIAADDFDHDLNTQLYMQNCAAAVFIDLNGQQPENVFSFVEGTANSFMVNDSVYSYDRGTIVKARKIAGHSRYCGFAAVCFPSKDNSGAARMQQEAAEDNGLWQMHVIVKINGKYTESILKVGDPLKAGQLKVVKVRMNSDGSVTPTMPSVGVSVKLDWKPGGSHDIIV